MCQPDKALSYYQQVADSEKDSAIGKAAAADAKRMKDSREVAFLEWFANQTQQKPKFVGEELSRLKKSGLMDRNHKGWFVPLWALRQAIELVNET